MIGININCKHQDFIDEILNGIKTIETRNTNSLKPYIGKRVGLIKTGCGKATLMGYARIGKIVRMVNSKEVFDHYYQWHRVNKDSPYYIKERKFMYQLYDIERCEPKLVESKGIIGRQI